MSQISNLAFLGSFALLLALALSAYCFVAGLIALAFPNQYSDRLGETARRAGIAVFGAVTLASIALVNAAFNDDFSIAYILHHSNRDLPVALQICRAVVRARRLPAFLVVAAGDLCARLAIAP